MKWKLTFAQKIRAAASLGVVFLLVLATNLMDKHHFSLVQKSLTTVYEDRLVAKDYIYKMAKQLQVKRSAALLDDKGEMIRLNLAANDSINVLMDKFATTKLTAEESRRFKLLKTNLNQLFAYEQKLFKGQPLDSELHGVKNTESYILTITEDLDALSEIQLKEGKKEITTSIRAIDTSNLIARLEIGALIIIGVIIQLLIFLKPLK